MEMNEQELALECGKENNLARKQLYEQYARQLMTLCIRYVGDREMAEGVLHDGFIHIFKTIKQFNYQGEGSLKAWLNRVMINEALGFLRKKNTLVQQEVPMETLPDLSDEEDDLPAVPKKVLMQFIQELPDGYRTVFNLYVFEEKSHKQIGEMLGITEHTSSSQFFRAKKILMKKINDYRKQNQ